MFSINRKQREGPNSFLQEINVLYRKRREKMIEK